MWQIINTFLCAIIMVTGVLIFGKIILKSKINVSKIYLLIAMFAVCLIYTVSGLFFSKVAKTLIMLIANALFYKKIFNISSSKSVFLTFIYVIIMILAEIIELFTLTNIIGMDKKFCYEMYAGSLLSNFLIFLLFLVMTLLLKKFITKLIDNNLVVSVKIIIFLILESLCILTFFYNFVKKFSFTGDSFVYLFASLVLLIVLFSLIKQIIINNKIKNDYDNLLEFMTTYEEEVENQRTLCHETKNEFLAIRAKICDKEKESEIINYIDEILGDTYSVKNEKYAKFGYLPANGIKGLCYFKVQKAEELGINVSINISKKIKKSTIFELDLKQQREFAKILGVFIDNAIEASSESKDKELGIEAYSNLENEFRMIISNTYNNEIDEEKIGKENFTTKGKNRGHGLLLVNQIVQKNNIFETKRSIKNDIYSQTIVVKKS